MRRFFIQCLLAGATVAAGMFVAGCGRDPGARDQPAAGRDAAPGRYKVVATIGMIADVVREVAGAHADVIGLIGDGIDPHLYTATRADIIHLSQADIIFYNGLMLEGKMGDVLVRMARQGKPVHAVTESILEQGDTVITDEDAYYDPHVWMDVGGWMLAVDVVADALAAFDPEHAAVYRDNARRYVEQLRGLDAYARTVLGTIPEAYRVLVTAHDAFGYLERAYGITVRGIQGLSTESEAGLHDIEALVRYLVERQIPAVFVETSVADKNVLALVEGARAQGHAVRIGGTLYSDAMGPSGSYEGTYIGMIDHNVTTIARALGGEAPAGGMQGQLRQGR